MPWEYRPSTTLTSSEESFADFRKVVAERDQHLARLGWRQLTTGEEARVEKQLGQHFPFGQPHPPIPHSVWDVAAITVSEAEYCNLERELNLRILESIRLCTAQAEIVLAIDWQHTWYNFKPHNFQTDGNAYDWAVEVLPELNNNFFTAEDFRFGVYGTPETNTITIYGSTMLDAIVSNLPTYLSARIL